MIANVPISETGTLDHRQDHRPPVLEEQQDDDGHRMTASRRVWNTSFTDSRTNGVVSYTIW